MKCTRNNIELIYQTTLLLKIPTNYVCYTFSSDFIPLCYIGGRKRFLSLFTQLEMGYEKLDYRLI